MATLYHYPLVSECRAIRILLKEKSLDCSLIPENFWERRGEFLQLNPAAEVPVLTGEDEVICGGYAIIEYLEEIAPDTNFLGKTTSERAEVRRLIEWFTQKFEREVMQYIVFEKVFKRLMGYGEPSSDALRAGKHNLNYHMEYIGSIAKQRRWLAGDKMTLADMMAAASFSILDYLGDIDWNQYEDVKEWYALMKSRPSFRSLLADRISGLKPPAYYENPDF
jgi:glutathione S-transferase